MDNHKETEDDCLSCGHSGLVFCESGRFLQDDGSVIVTGRLSCPECGREDFIVGEGE